ncbi:WecB/TagA/CpsF family glycosyltransferase [Cryobacterium sp. M91]|uniref:WecB/TagA/CpsF family glycosyltransferase n=1 Tax=Cryobacterium sp. M91 TaxID=2048294 RepID=UPI001304A2D8|nr:WecB/TagA/CpsF family glycosyltransferase [Cryobacterium sp. M91]
MSEIVQSGFEARTHFFFAIHVGGLILRHDRRFISAMSQADMVYADGTAVVLIARQVARRTGTTFRMERAPTTDIGWTVIAQLRERLDRPVRLALVGGPPGLAARASSVLAETGNALVVFVTHGYHEDWRPAVSEIAEAAPDLVLVGLGAPLEMYWCLEWRDALPKSVVMTCGGWFSFLSGDEKRSPRVLQRFALEWFGRLLQNPRRLFPRYTRGFVATCALLIRHALEPRDEAEKE